MALSSSELQSPVVNLGLGGGECSQLSLFYIGKRIFFIQASNVTEW